MSSRSSVDSLLVRTRFLTSIYPQTSIRDTPDQDERAAEASAALEADEETPSNAAAQPKGGEEKAGGKLHVLGIGGRRAKRGSTKTTGSKKTPGEIRIQKGENPQHGSMMYHVSYA